MSDPESGGKADPFQQWRGLRDTFMDSWAKALVEGVNTDAYAKASGAMLDSMLTASIPFREALEKAMLEALKQLSMPSRADVVSLAERFTNVELRLDDLDQKIDRIEQLLGKLAENQAQKTVRAEAADTAEAVAAGSASRTTKKGAR